MYSPASHSDYYSPYGSPYQYYANYPSLLQVHYQIYASDINPVDGSCTISLRNDQYAMHGWSVKDSKTEFKATPKNGVTFKYWKYGPTGSSGSKVAGDSGQLTPGSATDMTIEQLMTLTAVFEGTPEKLDPEITYPRIIEGLEYNASPQTLCTPGSTTGGTLYYALGNSQYEAPSSG